MKLSEAIYNGLTNLGAFIKEAKQDQIEYEQSIYRTGWLSDSEKLRLLKYDLYSITSARGDDKHLRQLRETITLLSKEVQAEHRRQSCRSRKYSRNCFTASKQCNYSLPAIKLPVMYDKSLQTSYKKYLITIYRRLNLV